jgi:starch synthase
MHIIQIATELAPIAKVGGLADVVYGLSKQLVQDGHRVEIILPKYDSIQTDSLKNFTIDRKGIFVTERGKSIHNLIWSATLENLRVVFIDPEHPKNYFKRKSIYGSIDDSERFIYFSCAALEYLTQEYRALLKKGPDVVHLHEWQTALIPVLYEQVHRQQGLKIGKTVFTIHNLQHQGKCPLSYFSQMKINSDLIKDPYSADTANLVKGAILSSDVITTVSPNYRREILTPEGGFGLDTLLKQHKEKLKGILNGIDFSFWDPEKDVYLKAHYSTTPPFTSEKMEHLLKAKKANQHHLKKQLGMKENEGRAPLVACISRLVYQKGPTLIKYALQRTLEKGGQFVLLGSSPTPDIDKMFSDLKKELENDKNVAICLTQDEALAHLIYASADLLAIPSLFEPCGLTQLIALRYGTIPMARMTGGLVDTVFDIDTSTRPEKERNGFTFDFPDREGVNWALDRAIDCHQKKPQKFHQVMRQGMHEDFSWKKSAKEYLELYQRKNLWKRLSNRFF